jgi:hypothetical protein
MNSCFSSSSRYCRSCVALLAVLTARFLRFNLLTCASLSGAARIL